jgi:hypothetical protein
MALHTGSNFVVISSPGGGRRIGIYARGGCHLQALFACGPLVQEVVKDTCCIFYDGTLANGRTDLELQTLRELRRECLRPVVEKMRLESGYFQPRLFEPAFTIPGREDLGEFPKSVVIISIASDAVRRNLYRHREHGFLIDPGGAWLRSVHTALDDLSAVAWFRQNFECVGPIDVDDFVRNFVRLVELVRALAGAPVMVFNGLSIDPGNLTHNYQCVKHSDGLRWRRFNVALTELSRQLDFPIVDLDWVLKRYGLRGQLTAAHFTPKANVLIAREAFRVMRELGLFDGPPTPEGYPTRRSQP